MVARVLVLSVLVTGYGIGRVFLTTWLMFYPDPVVALVTGYGSGTGSTGGTVGNEHSLCYWYCWSGGYGSGRVSSTDGDFHLLPLAHHPTPATDHHHLIVICWLLSGPEILRTYV